MPLFLNASRPSETGWGWSATVMPGYNAGFCRSRSGDGKIMLHAMADCPLSTRIRLKLGAAYDTIFGEPQIYPVSGIIRQISDAVTLRFLWPSPSLHWTPTIDFGLFALLQPAGNRWTDEHGNNAILLF